MGEIRLPRQMFLWSVAAVYMCAFTSLYVQIPGLYGDAGIQPVRLVKGLQTEGPLLERLLAQPCLLLLGPWVGLGPLQGLEVLCLLGALLALGALLLEALRDSLVFFCLWAMYLSIYQVGQDFLRCQWDSLLLETGFLAVLVAPLGLLRSRSSPRHHDPVTFWLTRWLLFRLTFGTGVAKLAGGDPAWWNLTALTHHYEVQGSPTPLAWYAHQLPDWLLKVGAVGLMEAQIVVPLLLFFAPIRGLRLGAFYIQVLVQLGGMLTGGCSVLSLLTIALSFSLLDDDQVNTWMGQRSPKKPKTWSAVSGLCVLVELAMYGLILFSAKELFHLELNWEQKTVSSKTNFTQKGFDEFLRMVTMPSVWIGVLSLTWEIVVAMLGCVCVRGVLWKLWALVQWAVFTAAAVGVFALSVVPYTAMEGVSSSKILPEVRKAYNAAERYRLVGAYGLRGGVTEVEGRPEIIVEGSMDKTTWTEIEFMYKPGNVSAGPPAAGPFQPRLDWQMWQAARTPLKLSPWFTGLVHRLLQGKEEVVGLIQEDRARYPFSQRAPAYIRASLYKYWFTQPAEDGSPPQRWWRRHYVEEFYPMVHLGDPALERMLSEHGLKEFPVQPSSDSAVAQALVLVRGHVSSLPGPLVLLALVATVTCIGLLRALLGRKPKPAPAEPKSRRTKEAAEKSATSSSGRGSRKENSQDKGQESDRSPRKRK